MFALAPDIPETDCQHLYVVIMMGFVGLVWQKTGSNEAVKRGDTLNTLEV